MGIIYQPNDTGNTAGAGWTCPYCNQLVGFGQPHACEVSDKPPTTEQLIAEIEWLRAEVERLRAALTGLATNCSAENIRLALQILGLPV